MNLKPLRGYILVEQIDDAGVTASGLVMPDSSKEKPMKGKVISIGLPPLAGKDDPQYAWEIKEGQVVVFKKWGGQDIDDKLKLVGHNELMGVYE